MADESGRAQKLTPVTPFQFDILSNTFKWLDIWLFTGYLGLFPLWLGAPSDCVEVTAVYMDCLANWVVWARSWQPNKSEWYKMRGLWYSQQRSWRFHASGIRHRGNTYLGTDCSGRHSYLGSKCYSSRTFLALIMSTLCGHSKSHDTITISAVPYLRSTKSSY